MESMNWFEILLVVIPSVVAAILAVAAFVLKLKKDTLQGMGKEVSELLLSIVEAAKDKKFTTAEIKAIIKEAQDVIAEAEKLIGEG